MENTEKSYKKLLEGNKRFVEETLSRDPNFFKKLEKGQNPIALWIGCADSRVPANQITGTLPGEIFVHRNIANMVVHTDINMLSVLEYAVKVLKVEHVIVCGHYGCGGVLAAMSNQNVGITNKWLRNIKDVYTLHKNELESIEDQEQKGRKLVELNVKHQVSNVAKTSIVQKAWNDKQPLALHGWVYKLGDGIIKDLDVTMENRSAIDSIFHYEL